MENMIQFDENENSPTPSSFDNLVPNGNNLLLDASNSEMKNSSPDFLLNSPLTRKAVLNEVNYNTFPVSDSEFYSPTHDLSEAQRSLNSNLFSDSENINIPTLLSGIESVPQDVMSGCSGTNAESHSSSDNVNNGLAQSSPEALDPDLPEEPSVKNESYNIPAAPSIVENVCQDISNYSASSESSPKVTVQVVAAVERNEISSPVTASVENVSAETVIENSHEVTNQTLCVVPSAESSLCSKMAEFEKAMCGGNLSAFNNNPTDINMSFAGNTSDASLDHFSELGALNSGAEVLDDFPFKVPAAPACSPEALDPDLPEEPSMKNESYNIPAAPSIVENVCQDISNYNASSESSPKVTVQVLTAVERNEIISPVTPSVENVSAETVIGNSHEVTDQTVCVVPSAESSLCSKMAEFEKAMCGENLSAFNKNPTDIKMSFAGNTCDASLDHFSELGALDGGAEVMDDFPFKVPAAPADNDCEEEFTDAVQFFKDPSSFQFLENIKTDTSSESPIPRSSLYVNFDPLHSQPNRPEDIVTPMVTAPGDLHTPLGSVDDGPEGESNDTSHCTPPSDDKGIVNKRVAMRESLGSILISFDSPLKVAKTPNSEKDEHLDPASPPKLYTEEEMQQRLKILELTIQEEYLKKQREMDREIVKKKEGKNAEVEKLLLLVRTQSAVIEELAEIATELSKKKDWEEKWKEMDAENRKLKDDLKTSIEDLQGVETTFADFHKRYEQSKSMLKVYKGNEDHWKAEIKEWELKMKEQEQMYHMLKERTEESLGKANSEMAGVIKTSEAQIAVLKAQLKKAELKISALESDIKQVKTENSQLGGLCDDLMAKVSEA